MKISKKIIGYALIMVFFVGIIVLIGILSDNELDSRQKEYEKEILGTQNQIEALEKKIVDLSAENDELKKKLEAEEKQNDENVELQSKFETSSQALSDLKDIYDLYKSGDKAQAKALLSKIEPIGFDDASLAYYDLLKDFIN